MVGVGTPPLPQPRTGPGAHGQHGRGIGHGEPPVKPLGYQRILSVLLDPLLVLLVLLDLLRMGLAPVLLVHEVVAEEDQRAQQSHDQVVPAPEDHHGDDRADQRGQGHQPGQRPRFEVARRGGQLEPGLAFGRLKAGRPVVVEPGPVVGPLQRGVGRGVAVEFEKGVADGDLGTEGPVLAVEGLTVEGDAALVLVVLLFPVFPVYGDLTGSVRCN
jgi:hypothetical protein